MQLSIVAESAVAGYSFSCDGQVNRVGTPGWAVGLPFGVCGPFDKSCLFSACLRNCLFMLSVRAFLPPNANWRSHGFPQVTTWLEVGTAGDSIMGWLFMGRFRYSCIARPPRRG